MESCRTTTIEDAVSTMSKFLGFILAVLLAGPAIFAQSAPPVLSGDFQFVGSSNAGALSFQPVFYPVLLVPLGKHWLIESRADLQGFISRENGKTGPYEASFVNSLDYLQVDYIANAHVTFTAGRFLVPFNMFGLSYYLPHWHAHFGFEQRIYASWRYRRAGKLGIELHRLLFGLEHD